MAPLQLCSRPAAAAPIQPLARGLPYATAVAPKRKKRRGRAPFIRRDFSSHSLSRDAFLGPEFNSSTQLINCDSRTLEPTIFFFFFFLFFLGLHLRHMEVLRPGVKSELHLQLTPQLAATPDPSPTERGQGWVQVHFLTR